MAKEQQLLSGRLCDHVPRYRGTWSYSIIITLFPYAAIVQRGLSGWLNDLWSFVGIVRLIVYIGLFYLFAKKDRVRARYIDINSYYNNNPYTMLVAANCLLVYPIIAFWDWSIIGDTMMLSLITVVEIVSVISSLVIIANCRRVFGLFSKRLMKLKNNRFAYFLAFAISTPFVCLFFYRHIDLTIVSESSFNSYYAIEFVGINLFLCTVCSALLSMRRAI
jgi:hypothetical protein